MKLDVYSLVVIFISLEVVFSNGEFTCYRRFLKKRSLCKGPVKKRTHKFNTPEKCCHKKGQGFYSVRLPTGKQNKYVCTPCSALLTTTTETPVITVDGNWGPWFGWSPCTASCGSGTRRRERRCNYPPPTHGGKDCPGKSERLQNCNEDPCPVDGNWSQWSKFSLCSATCGFGTMMKTRECNDPAPAHGGAECKGSPVHHQRCNHRQCPQHGGWSLWSSWSSCPITCGEGARIRTRKCDSPRPLFGGDKCDGSDKDQQTCRLPIPCPVHGQWTEWTNFGRCHGPPCGKGTQRRSRSCTNPTPRHGGRSCRGYLSESRICVNDHDCPGAHDPQWCQWNEWSPCTATCTGINSMQVRQRACLCPAPKTIQEHCDGDSFQIRECLHVPKCGEVVLSSRDKNVGSGQGLNTTSTTSFPEVKLEDDNS